MRWDRLPPSRPSTKSGARAGGRRLSDRRLHRWLAGTSASAPSSHGAADLLGLNRAHICVRNLKTFSDRDTAWQQVCEGLRALIDGLRENFTIKAEFRHEMEQTEFISSDHVLLPQIFVFPRLSSYRATKAQDRVETTITSAEQLFRSKHLLIHGDELSGKTALCRHLFLTLVDDAKPVLYVDLTTLNGRASAAVFRDAYDQEFNGDYSLWKSKTDKTIVLDNLSQASHAHEHVLLAVEHFERVIVTVSSHTFYAYFRDDDRLAQFRVIQILPLTHSAQERLIRQRLSLSDNCSAEALDGRIDQVENQVNAIVLSNKIVPRYPFYVLSILQTHEAFMPGNLSITSHGHCYHVLILSYLIKAGISRADDEIDSCLNFAEQLAYEMHCIGTERDGIGADAFEGFVKKYKNTYLLKESTLSRLCDRDYGILSRPSGRFKIPYMYYFFLGRYLAKYADKHKSVIDRMLERSYVKSNCLTLIFIIHHTSDNAIIEDIVLRNMCTLDKIKPAILDKNEARIFDDIVSAIPADILSKDSVGSERQRERVERERQESQDEGLDAETSIAVVNDVYRILKKVPLRDRCSFGRFPWLISQALSVTYMAGERRLYLERNCRLPESPAHSRQRNREGPASSKGLNSQRGFGPAVEPRRKSRPRSTSLHGSSPCKCQRLSTLRWDRLPPSRPSTKSGARAGGRRLSDRRLHRWLAGTSASAPSSHGAADLLGLNRAHICVRNPKKWFLSEIGAVLVGFHG